MHHAGGVDVRSTDPYIAELIVKGQARSPTFERLVATLDASDVIVYVEPQVKRTHLLGGYLVASRARPAAPAERNRLTSKC